MNFIVGCVLLLFVATELVGPDWRLFVGMMFSILWAIGYMIIAGMAYIFRSRLVLEMVLTVPLVPYLFAYW